MNMKDVGRAMKRYMDDKYAELKVKMNEKLDATDDELEQRMLKDKKLMENHNQLVFFEKRMREHISKAYKIEKERIDCNKYSSGSVTDYIDYSGKQSNKNIIREKYRKLMRSCNDLYNTYELEMYKTNDQNKRVALLNEYIKKIDNIGE